MNNNIDIFSKALYSSWCSVPTYKILFDCGEGCATAIGNSLAGIDHIFLGHDHGDHTLGLPSVIGCRNAGRGISRNEETMTEHNKPLKVYYPADNRLMDSLIDFVEIRYARWLRYRLDFVPIEAGFELDLGDKKYLRAFNMHHQKSQTTLGYVIYENRTRLKREFVGQDIRALFKNGWTRDQVNETYRANLFAYCLDAYKIDDYNQLANCRDVIMDCTFMNEADRTDNTHYTLDEARKVCSGNGVKNMYAAHLSGRYDFNDMVRDHPDVHFINPFKVNHL